MAAATAAFRPDAAGTFQANGSALHSVVPFKYDSVPVLAVHPELHSAASGLSCSSRARESTRCEICDFLIDCG